MSDISQLNPELMLRHAHGLRALVRELVVDDSRVDDVLQETWLRAIENPPRSEDALGAWLRKVAARIAHRVRNGDDHRAHHEVQAAREERVPSAAEIVDREMARRKVVDAVLGLREPYRAMVLHRYFQNLSAQQIANRLDLPVETVRTRIKRGLALLRSRLDETHGRNPGRWHLALLPITTLPVAGAVKATAAGAMGTAAWRTFVLVWLAFLGWTTHMLLQSDRGDELPPTVAFSEFELKPVDDAEAPPAIASASATRGGRTAGGRSSLPVSRASRRTLLVVEGRVVDGSADPVADARISLRLWHSHEHRAQRVGRPVTTEASGRFRFEGPAFEETTLVVTAQHRQLAPAADVYRWHVKEGAIDIGDIVLKPGGGAQGRVVDEDGAPITGAEVSVFGSSAASYRTRVAAGLKRSVRTDVDGVFAIHHVPGGTLVLRAQARGYRAVYSSPYRVSAGSRAEIPALRLERGRELAGVVYDADGKPVSRATVRARSRRGRGRRPMSTRTDRQGRFRLAGLPAGSLRLTAFHWRHATTRQAVDDVADPPLVELRMQPRLSIAGRVVDARTGEPIEEFAVHARSWPAAPQRGGPGDAGRERRQRRAAYRVQRLGGVGAIPRSARRPRERTNGEFRLDRLQPGSHAIEVHAPGFVRMALGPFVVENGGHAADMMLQLPRGGAIGGAIVDRETGKPVAAAKVELLLPFAHQDGFDPQSEQPGTLLDTDEANAAGAFQLGRYLPGRFHVRVRAPDRMPHLQAVDLRAGEDLVLAIALEPGARVHGRVRNWETGVRGLVVFTHQSGSRHAAPVDPETGAYEVLGLRQGGYRVRVDTETPGRSRSAPRADRDFDLILGDSAVLRHDLDRRPTAGRLVGRVGLNQAAPRGLRARLRPQVGAGATPAYGGDLRGDIDQDGRFAIRRAPAGAYTLDLYRPGVRVLHRTPVTISAGETVMREIDLQTGCLRLQVRTPDTPTGAIVAMVVRADEAGDLTPSAWDELPSLRHIPIEGTDALAEELECGDYVFAVSGEGCDDVTGEAQVRIGETTAPPAVVLRRTVTEKTKR